MLSLLPLASDAVSESPHVVPLYQEMIKIFASSASRPSEHYLSCTCSAETLLKWLHRVHCEHRQNKELSVIQWTSFIKICLMYGAINLDRFQVQMLSGSRLYIIAKNQSLPLLPIIEAIISMMQHHTFEAFRLGYDEIWGPVKLMPSPRCLVDLCRLWIYEHTPRGQMPSIAAQLGLPSAYRHFLAADTSPVLEKYTFHRSRAKKTIMQNQNRIAQMQ